MASDRPSAACCDGRWHVAQAMSRLPLRILSNISAWPRSTSAGSCAGIGPIGTVPQRCRDCRSSVSSGGGSVSGGVTASQPAASPSRPRQIARTMRVIIVPPCSPQRERDRDLVRGGADLLQTRSEEHTSELQSRLHLVCRLLLEKKKTESSI